MRRWVICFSHSRTCSAVTRSIWFQKLWEDSAAGSAGRRRVRTVWRAQAQHFPFSPGGTPRQIRQRGGIGGQKGSQDGWPVPVSELHFAGGGPRGVDGARRQSAIRWLVAPNR